MQKILFLLAVLLPLTASAQKPVVQQAAYAGIGGATFQSLGYEARFRNFNKKPDYALGIGLTMRSFGIRPSASVLFGKGSSAFELGLNSSIMFYPNADFAYYNTGLTPYTQSRMFLGYRLQPKNHRFFLQFQYAPLVLSVLNQSVYKYDPSSQSYKSMQETITALNTPFATYSNYAYNPLTVFELRLGINLNRLQDTTTENTAYEAPKNTKLPLQHAFMGGLNFNYFGGLSMAYDLRWRRPQKVDFAADISFKIPNDAYYFTPKFQALALFGEGNACLETGLSLDYLSLNKDYFRQVNSGYNNVVYDYAIIGVPLGFRYQPPKGFFMRIYAMPYRNLLPVINTYPYYSANIPPLISGVSLSTNFGYTF
jgi:hypothetical protein